MKAFLVAACTLMLAGCATRGGAQDGRLEQAIGTTSLFELTETSNRVLLNHAFQIQRIERQPRVRIETYWRDRPPFPDELAAGVEEAQTRLIITGMPRGQTPMGTTYSVRVLIENRVMIAGGDDWRFVAATPLYRRWADQIAAALRADLTSGVRTY